MGTVGHAMYHGMCSSASSVADKGRRCSDRSSVVNGLDSGNSTYVAYRSCTPTSPVIVVSQSVREDFCLWEAFSYLIMLG